MPGEIITTDERYRLGEFWLDRHPKSPFWQICRYDKDRRQVTWKSTGEADFEEAKTSLHDHIEDRARDKRDSTIWLYVIQCAVTDRVKIGISNDPQARLATLQCGSPTQLNLLATILGNKADERQLHNTLHESRAHGEWFDWTDRVQRVVRWRFRLNERTDAHRSRSRDLSQGLATDRPAGA